MSSEPPVGDELRRKRRRDRIIDVAVRLAAEGGFENVRQRDVAAQAGVALGTLYKSFRSKEDILSAALERETTQLEGRLDRRPAAGADPVKRVSALFRILTQTICRKPNYARAVLRAVASGQPEVARSVAAHQSQITRMILDALRGPTTGNDAVEPTEAEARVALFLQHIWFASLVGWTAELHSQQQVVEQMDQAAALLIRGMRV